MLACEGSEDLVLFVDGLEATMSHLGGSIDELDVDWSKFLLVGWWEDGFPHGDDLLLGANNAALDHDEVFFDDTVMRETAKWGDVLFDKISLGGGVVLDAADLTGTDAVDLLVELSTMMITELARSSYSPGDGHWMPSTDTSYLSETSMGLSGEPGHTESLDDTGGTLAASDTDGINHLEVGEDLTNRHFLLEVLFRPVDLVLNFTSIELDFHEVSFLLAQMKLANLGVRKDADNLAVFIDAL